MFYKCFFYLVACFILISCESITTNNNWSDSMGQMAQAYEKLLPFIYSERNFADPGKKRLISLRIQQLRDGANHLDKHIADSLSGGDPLFEVGLAGLKNQIHKADESFFVGEHEYARHLLQYSLNYCNGCHMKAQVGPQFIKPDQFGPLFDEIDFIERSKIFVATREFEKATQELLSGINSSSAKEKKTQQNAINQLLLLGVWSPNSKKELRTKLNGIKLDVLYPELRSLVKKWRIQLQSKSALDDSAEVIVSRFLKNKENSPDLLHSIMWSTKLHNSLSHTKQSIKRATIFYALGKIYQENSTLKLVGLPETYFESCILTFPGSNIATKCYYSLEYYFIQAKRQGHPVNVLNDRLKALKIKAKVRKSSPSSAGSYSVGEEK